MAHISGLKIYCGRLIINDQDLSLSTICEGTDLPVTESWYDEPEHIIVGVQEC